MPVIPISLKEFAERCGGTVHGEPNDLILDFATDDRAVKKGDLFICIKGERVDGHQFAAHAIHRGAVACLCTEKLNEQHILVSDIAEALKNFGQSKRKVFSGPVIAVTGSAGKTTTKEFIAAACSPLGNVVKSEGNRNTEYTSPLLWAEVDEETSTVVVEMGMRGSGQISHLAHIAQPTIGVITQIGTSHIEKVGSREGIFAAKSELLQALPANGTAIFWQEDDFLPELMKVSPCKTMTFGFSQEANCRILGYRSVSWEKSVVIGFLDGVEFQAELPTTGRHQALNAAAAILAAHVCGVGVSESAKNIQFAKVPPLRLQVEYQSGATIVLDTYNASPDSTVASLKTLAEIPAEGRKIAILGEMKELGTYSESGHRRVGAALAESMIDLTLLTGGATRYIAEQALSGGFPEERIKELVEFNIEQVRDFLQCIKQGDVVLIKGSRALGLERAVEVLQK